MESNTSSTTLSELKDIELYNEAVRLHQEILALNNFDESTIKKIRDFKSLINEYQNRLTQLKAELDSTLAA